MLRFALYLFAVELFLPIVTFAPAHATRTLVARVGDDVNPGSRAIPCKIFTGAISRSAVAREINCIDQGAVTIARSMAISCVGVTAGVVATLNTSGVIVDAGANDNTVLRGLDIGGGGAGGNAIRFLAGKSLTVEDAHINGFDTSNGLGIQFVPTTSSFLSAINTTITNTGNSFDYTSALNAC